VRTKSTKEAVHNVAKILVVDDEHTIADTLATILNNAGFEASAVYSGAEAVEVAKSVEPDLIISDVAMPDMNGIEAMILIRGFLPTCKVLLFSGQASTVDLLKSARAREYEFEILAKPIHPQDLIARLTALTLVAPESSGSTPVRRITRSLSAPIYGSCCLQSAPKHMKPGAADDHARSK
jgi:DNA-binding response OmpR family regulator